MVKALKGKLVDETPCELGGEPGRELTIEIPKTVAAGDAVGRARISLMGRRLYELIAVQPAAEAKTVDRFFASFKPAARPVATTEVAAQDGKPDSKRRSTSSRRRPPSRRPWVRSGRSSARPTRRSRPTSPATR